jgi:hypothetical protein
MLDDNLRGVVERMRRHTSKSRDDVRHLLPTGNDDLRSLEQY